MNKISNHYPGFTLIELAVVLVIIGLITGGVMTGQSMLKAAKIREQITQFESYKQAVSTFEDLYGGIPGDITNAVELFGATGITNGNGNGRIEAGSNWWPLALDSPDHAYYTFERPQFFVHLYQAKLTNQAFDGSATLGSGYPRMVLNKNTGMFAAGAWDADWANDQYTNSSVIANGNLHMSANIANPQFFNVDSRHNDNAGIFTPVEANEIDKKIDDGVPSAGIIIGQAWGVPVWCCSATTYNLGETSSRVCNILYNIGDR